MVSQRQDGVPNFNNRTLYHSDNLEIMREMNSESVNLIATDPPFNKKKDFHDKNGGFGDRWDWDKDVQQEWVDQIKDNWRNTHTYITSVKEFDSEMAAYLCWLGVRLMEMRRVLRSDGSIYLHIDHTAHAYVKCLMDTIFVDPDRRKRFRNQVRDDLFQNEIIWAYRSGGASKSRFSRKHDVLLFYTKTGDYVFNAPRERSYNRNDKPYRFSGVEEYQDEQGRWYTLPMMRDVWEIPMVGRTSKERRGYATQKPVTLYGRIIDASSNEGDIVLDPFCGCATTLVAAEQRKRQWVGIDIWEGSYEEVVERLNDEWMLVDGQLPEGTIPMFPHKVHFATTPPIRNDEGEVAAPGFWLKRRRPTAPWEKIAHRGMVNVLSVAQRSDGKVICAGCGRVLERDFMQLDHITPKAPPDNGENHILNRILLCGPCNRHKGNKLTLAGLWKDNIRRKWMQDQNRARIAQSDAREKAEWVSSNFHAQECRDLIAGKVDAGGNLL